MKEGTCIYSFHFLQLKNGSRPSTSGEDPICLQTPLGVPFPSVGGTENNVLLHCQPWYCKKQLCGEQEKREEVS